MIAAQIIAYKNGDVSRHEPALLELTDTNIEGKHIGIAFEHGKERIYLEFRLSDLLREVKEAAR